MTPNLSTWRLAATLSVLAACSTPPRASPDAAASAPIAARPVLSPSLSVTAEAPTAAADAGLEQELQEVEAFPPDEPNGLRPQRLKVLIDQYDDEATPAHAGPYLSEDGSTAILFRRSSTLDPPTRTRFLKVWPLDALDRAHDMVFLDGPVCNSGPESPPCNPRRTQAAVRPLNAFLAKHRWVEFRQYGPKNPANEGPTCFGTDLASRFRVEGYEVQFRDPELRIARADGAIVVERKDVMGTWPECPPDGRRYVVLCGVDVRRRAMFLILRRCAPVEPRCDLRDDWLFFRLPKAAK